MLNNKIDRRRPPLSVWSAALLGAGGIVGLWLWLAQGDRLQVLLASAVLGLIAILGFIVQARVRAARRLQATLDAYAERQLAQALRRTTPKRSRSFSTRPRVPNEV